MHSSHRPSEVKPGHLTAPGGWSSTLELLLISSSVFQTNSPPQQSPLVHPANQTEQQVDGEQPLVHRRPYNQLAAASTLALLSHQPLVLEQSQPVAGPNPAAVTTDNAAIQVKEERRHGHDSEETCIETHPEEEEQEVVPCERGGEELDISFDSQFPDLISDLITDEANPVADPPVATMVSHPSVFPAGVRYMVPPQPSPSSSFLPFPHPLPPSSSSRLASITDFSPEWSYPEVTNQLPLNH